MAYSNRQQLELHLMSKETHDIKALLAGGYETWFWFGLCRKDAIVMKKWLVDHSFLIDLKAKKISKKAELK